MLDWLVVDVLFSRTQCLLLPLVVHLSNFNELSLNCQPDVTNVTEWAHDSLSENNVFKTELLTWKVGVKTHSNWTSYNVSVTSYSVQHSLGLYVVRAYKANISYFWQTSNTARRQETIMSWNTSAAWKHGIKMALLLMITPTLKRLMPRFPWTRLISLTDGMNFACNAVRCAWGILFCVICWDLKLKDPSSNIMEGPHKAYQKLCLLCTCQTHIKWKK